jgi:hypothetical protein
LFLSKIGKRFEPLLDWFALRRQTARAFSSVGVAACRHAMRKILDVVAINLIDRGVLAAGIRAPLPILFLRPDPSRRLMTRTVMSVITEDLP